MPISGGKTRYYFGYDNPLAFRIIPIGRRNSIGQAFDAGQPTQFLGGRQNAVFFVDVAAGASPQWRLEGRDLSVPYAVFSCSGDQLFNLPMDSRVSLRASLALSIADRARVVDGSGFASILSYGTTELSASVSVGNVWSQGNVFLGSGAHVQGNLVTAGTIQRQNDVTISGTTVTNGYIPASDIAWSSAPIAASAPNVNLEPSQVRALTTGDYGNVRVATGGHLRLNAGLYRFRSLQLEPGAEIVLTDASTTTIHVLTDLQYRGFVTLGDGALLVGYFGANTATFEASFTGRVFAPTGTLSLGGNVGTTYAGQFFASTVRVNSGIIVSR